MSLYHNLIETVALLGAEVLYAHDVAGDERSDEEIGEELLIAVGFPDIAGALQCLREAGLDRASESSIPVEPAGEPAKVFKLRRRLA
jgi:hypothetical protein